MYAVSIDLSAARKLLGLRKQFHHCVNCSATVRCAKNRLKQAELFIVIYYAVLGVDVHRVSGSPQLE